MIQDENTTPENEENTLSEEASGSEFAAKEPEARKPAKVYGTGTAIAAFIFFAITACVFIVYEYFAITFLYMPFANGVNDIGEAIAAIFGYTFGLVITIIFGVAQLPENIIAIALFRRVRSCATGGKRILYTVFLAISIAMLVLMILTIGIFFAIIGTNS